MKNYDIFETLLINTLSLSLYVSVAAETSPPPPPATTLTIISPERPTLLRIQACTYQMEPFHLDTLLFFPPALKFCATLETDKQPNSLMKDHRRAVILHSFVQLSLRQVISPIACTIGFTGYVGEYRFAPDYGFYLPCQQSIAEHVNWILQGSREFYSLREQQYLNKNSALGGESREDSMEANDNYNEFNDLKNRSTDIERSMESSTTFKRHNQNCPIRSLPTTSKELHSCEVVERRWYELTVKSGIRYEPIRSSDRRSRWSNQTKTFMFKATNYVEQNGTDVDWLQRLFHLKTRLRYGCSEVRYLLALDEHWPYQELPIEIVIDYQVRENAYVKHFRHLGNGTLDQWFTGIFPVWRTPDPRIYELCVQFYWPTSTFQKLRLCRAFFHSRPTTHCMNNKFVLFNVSSGSTNYISRIFLLISIFIGTFIRFFSNR